MAWNCRTSTRPRIKRLRKQVILFFEGLFLHLPASRVSVFPFPTLPTSIFRNEGGLSHVCSQAVILTTAPMHCTIHLTAHGLEIPAHTLPWHRSAPSTWRFVEVGRVFSFKQLPCEVWFYWLHHVCVKLKGITSYEARQ